MLLEPEAPAPLPTSHPSCGCFLGGTLLGLKEAKPLPASD